MQLKSFIGRYGVMVLSMFTICLGGFVFASSYGKKMMNEGGMGVSAIEPAAGDEKLGLENANVEIKPGDPTVAVIDTVEIKRSEIFDMIDELAGPQQVVPKQIVFPVVLDQFVNGKIVELKADKSDVMSSDEYKARLEDTKKQIARAVFIENQVNDRITDEALKAAYDEYAAEQKSVEELSARHILVGSEDEAKEIIAALDGGKDFAELAKEKSTGPSGENGGDLGYFKKGDMVPAFEEAAFKLEKGAYTKAPVQTQFGFHVIKVEDKRNLAPESFEDMKESLQASLRTQILQDLLGDWRSEAKVQLYNINGEAEAADAKK
ncbi:MAG: peptidylprolyl isomerase [Alphaproteobacteria bacterium]|nr:peptidylprolyl isomerase [Alphaproteobacteria bacterium]